MQFTYFLSCPDDPESVFPVQADAGGVFREYACLKRPYPAGFRFTDKLFKQAVPDFLSSEFFIEIYAYLGYSRINASF